MSLTALDIQILKSFERVLWACFGLELALERAKEPDSAHGGPAFVKKAIEEWRDAYSTHIKLAPNNYVDDMIKRLSTQSPTPDSKSG